MSTAAGRPPQLPLKAITAVICRYFNFKEVFPDSIKEFPSYEDRNYYFRGESLNAKGCEYVLKLSNPLCVNLDVAIGLNSVMKHLSSCGFLTPYPQLSKSGSDTIQLTGAELKVISEDFNESPLETLNELNDVTEKVSAKSKPRSHEVGDSITNRSSYSGKEESNSYVIRVFSFIPGQLFDNVEKRFLTPGLVYTTGEMLGRLDKELMENFSNEAIESRYFSWDMMHFLDTKELLQDFNDPDQRSKAEIIYKAYEENVIPKISTFKKGVIHGDPNGLNLILKEAIDEDAFQFSGYIDFSDCTKTCSVFDLGICMAYMMTENLNPVTCSGVLEFVSPLIQGYNSVLPLNQNEVDALYYLVLARCCHSAVNGVVQFKAEPWNTYLLTTPEKAWKVIDKLLGTPKEYVNRIWKID